MSYTEQLENRIEVLEQQLAYECECNKQFVEVQNKLELAIDVLEHLSNGSIPYTSFVWYTRKALEEIKR